MKKYFSYLTILSILALTLAGPALAQENKKLAQTGMKFLSTSLDARASGMARAMTAVYGNSSALLYNPAGLAGIDKSFDFTAGRVSFIADINYIYGTAAFVPGQGEWGVFGLSFVSVDYGDLMATMRAENEQGFIDLGLFNPLAFAVGIGYSKSLTSQFSIGAHVKYVQQDLGGGFVDFNADQSGVAIDASQDVIVFDFGVLYSTGFESLNFGMSIRNFSEEIRYLQESFQLPLTFRIGLSMNTLDLTSINPDQHSLLLSVDASHPRDYAEQIGFGLEYVFMKMFALRAGYEFPNDEHGFSAGVGFSKDFGDVNFGLDYAYTPFGIFEDVHRFSFQFGL
jgi:opacity protein-like surface antigen